MADTDAEELTLAELSKRSGVEPHTLTRWASRGIFPGVPKHVGSGNDRTWNPGQVPVARMLAHVMRVGITETKTLRKVASDAAMMDSDDPAIAVPLSLNVTLEVEL